MPLLIRHCERSEAIQIFCFFTDFMTKKAFFIWIATSLCPSQLPTQTCFSSVLGRGDHLRNFAGKSLVLDPGSALQLMLSLGRETKRRCLASRTRDGKAGTTIREPESALLDKMR